MMNLVFKEGCMLDWADNYDSLATIDDGSCELKKVVLDWADNYDPLVTIDDGSCELRRLYVRLGR